MAKILILDDNLETLKLLRELLEKERFSVDSAESADEAWGFIETYEYDCMVFDWEMPQTSGIELLRKFRESGGKTPVLMLTGRNATSDKIKGLDGGADNYLTKPFENEELLGFIRAILRRGPEEKTEQIKCGDLELYPASSTVKCGSQQTTLSTREVIVLKLFLSSPNRIVSHDELKNTAWTESPDTASGTIRVFLSGLREKLTSLGSKIQLLNVRGYGYQIKF